MDKSLVNLNIVYQKENIIGLDDGTFLEVSVPSNISSIMSEENILNAFHNFSFEELLDDYIVSNCMNIYVSCSLPFDLLDKWADSHKLTIDSYNHVDDEYMFEIKSIEDFGNFLRVFKDHPEVEGNSDLNTILNFVQEHHHLFQKIYWFEEER